MKVCRWILHMLMAGLVLVINNVQYALAQTECRNATDEMYETSPALDTAAGNYYDEVMATMRSDCIKDAAGGNGTEIEGCDISVGESNLAKGFALICVGVGVTPTPEIIGRIWWYDVVFKCTTPANGTTLPTKWPDMGVDQVQICTHEDCEKVDMFDVMKHANEELIKPFTELGYTCSSSSSEIRETRDPQDDDTSGGIPTIGGALGMGSFLSTTLKAIGLTWLILKKSVCSP